MREIHWDLAPYAGKTLFLVVRRDLADNCFLTAARDPARSGFRNSISRGQIAVEQLGSRRGSRH